MKFENDELRHIPPQASEEQNQRIKELEKLTTTLKAELKQRALAAAESAPAEEVEQLKRQIQKLKVRLFISLPMGILSVYGVIVHSFILHFHWKEPLRSRTGV